ncbi:Uncharacterized protein Fot_29235 [Forsythia ovata]|uniref:Uncharacterized protein n=1 Tax=Forsythia ovata TaxID=205694 RepID=A0ABD1TRD0_9LAMI
MIHAKDKELTEVLNELTKAKGLLAKLGVPGYTETGVLRPDCCSDGAPNAQILQTQTSLEHNPECRILASRFRCKVPDLVDRETHLEDSSGQLWPVTYSNIEGSLAFSQGMARVFTRCKQGGTGRLSTLEIQHQSRAISVP